MTRQTILILDFGSQYTQLIARRVRENKVFSRIIPYNTPAKEIAALSPKGLILSGGPASVTEKKSPLPDKGIFKLAVPILGICYGMQVIAEMQGGRVKHTRGREYGKTELFVDENRDLFNHLPGNFTCWASHGDYVSKLPPGFVTIAHTQNAPIAGIACPRRKIYAVQFHPEVSHTEKGIQILANFLFKICGALSRWTMQSFIREALPKIGELRKRFKKDVEVDGGITIETAKEAVSAGANVLVAGTAVFGSKDYKETIRKLKNL